MWSFVSGFFQNVFWVSQSISTLLLSWLNDSFYGCTPFIQQALGLFPPWGHCELSCYKCSGSLRKDTAFTSLEVKQLGHRVILIHACFHLFWDWWTLISPKRQPPWVPCLGNTSGLQLLTRARDTRWLRSRQPRPGTQPTALWLPPAKKKKDEFLCDVSYCLQFQKTWSNLLFPIFAKCSFDL